MFDQIETNCTATAKIGSYIIKGDPIPLARHRMAKGRAYDSQRHLKMVWGAQLRQLHGDIPFFKGPLHIECNFYMQLPASMSKKKKDTLINTPHIFTPDLDNLVKFCADVAIGILYEDDNQICSILARKLYALEPQTIMTITELKKP